MGIVRNHRQQNVVYRLAAVVLVAGGLVIFGTAAAFAAGTISVNLTTGLSQGQIVLLSGTGLADSAPGYVVECNDAPKEPTVLIGSPFNQAMSVGCSAPSLKHLVFTTASGSLSATFSVIEGRKMGPPCGIHPVIAGCPHVDSANKKPRADAQNYPCPPTPAQLAAGVTCSLVFFDTAQERVSAPIAFLGGGPPIPGPPTTVPKTTPTTVPKKTTPTTVPKTTKTTTPTTVPKTTIATATPATAPLPVIRTVTNAAPPSTTQAAVKASSSSLAFTGLGKIGHLLALLGVILVVVGLALYFVDVRKAVQWLLGL
jgi:hypothetical protein